MTTANKGLNQPAYNSNVNTWGTGPLNDNFGYIDLALGGSTLLNATGLGGTTVALTASQCVPLTFAISGVPGGVVTYSVPASVGGQWVVRNGVSDGYAVRVQSAAGGTYVTINPGDNVQVSCDGTASGMVRNDTTASAGGSTTQVQYNNAGVLAGSANLVFNGTQLTGHTIKSSTGGFIFPDATTQTTAAVTTAPGGSTTQVQYNNAGAFAGSANLTFNGSVLTSAATIAMSAAAFNGAVRVDVASATTCAIGAAVSNYVRITGTTTITSLGTVASGIYRDVVFAGALTLTYNATSLILPTAANIVTVAGDTAGFASEGSGNWRCLWYARASGAAVKGSVLQMVNTADGTYSTNAATIPSDNTKPQSSEGTEFLSRAITPISATSKLVVEVTLVCAATNNDIAVVALFQDAGVDAISAVPTFIGGFPVVVTFRYEVTSGSTTARTFKVRAGCNTHTILINGANAIGAVLDGLCASAITVTEIAA